MEEQYVTGGWKTIYGEQRFIPLGITLKKLAHCKSCTYFSQTGLCQLTGSFMNGDSEACKRYVSKNEGKVKVYW